MGDYSFSTYSLSKVTHFGQLGRSIATKLLVLSVEESLHFSDPLVLVLEVLSTQWSLHAKDEEKVPRCEVE